MMNKKSADNARFSKSGSGFTVCYYKQIQKGEADQIIGGRAGWDVYGDDVDVIGPERASVMGEEIIRMKKPVAVRGRSFFGGNKCFYTGMAYITQSDDVERASSGLELILEFNVNSSRPKPLDRSMGVIGAKLSELSGKQKKKYKW